MTDLMIEYATAYRGPVSYNPAQLLIEAEITANVAYLCEIDAFNKLCTVSYDEGTYTEEQVLVALLAARPQKVTDSGAEFYARYDDAIAMACKKSSAAYDFSPEGFASILYPRNWVKLVGFWLTELPPYFADRRATNGYEALTPEEKTAFEAKFIVGGVNRWIVLYNLIVYMREIFSEDPADWATWDAAHTDITKADITELLETVYSWSL